MAEKKTTQTKASLRNGRASKTGGVYNANHNTLEVTRKGQPHIDAQKFELNRYFKFTEDDHNFKIKTILGGQGGFDSRKHERDVYEKRYTDGLEARNARYRKEGHPERCQTIKDIYSNPKTAPLETIFQIGNSKMIEDGTMTPQEMSNKLTIAWKATMRQIVAMGKGHVIPLDAALHCEEAVPHIHFRAAMGTIDKFGHFMPNQSAALESMGFDGRNPETGKKDRYHNPLVAYTDRIREIFYAECEKLGLVIDREVKSHSRRQVEILEYKCDKFREENQALEQQGRDLRQQAREAQAKADAAEARQAQAAQRALAAQEALEAAQGSVLSLKEQITALTASQEAAEAENKRLSDKKDELEKILAEVKAQGREALAQNKQLKADNKALEDRNQKLTDHQQVLETRLDEVIAQGKATVAENQRLQNKTKQLQDQVDQLQAEVDGLEMQLAQLRDAKTAAERETEQAKADRAAALEAAQKLEKYQRDLFHRQNSRLIQEFDTLPAQKEKKNFRGQVVQEERPECVIVSKKDLERVEQQAKYNVHVHCTEATIKELNKKISENSTIQELKAQVDKLATENRKLRWERNSLSQDNAAKQQTIQQQKDVLERFGLSHWAEGGTTQTNLPVYTNDDPNRNDRQ